MCFNQLSSWFWGRTSALLMWDAESRTIKDVLPPAWKVKGDDIYRMSRFSSGTRGRGIYQAGRTTCERARSKREQGAWQHKVGWPGVQDTAGMTGSKGQNLIKYLMLMQRSGHLSLFGHSVTVPFLNYTTVSIGGITSSPLYLTSGHLVKPGVLILQKPKEPL